LILFGPPHGSARTERYQKATLSLAAHFVLLPPLAAPDKNPN
jgi:hypothetical protein